MKKVLIFICSTLVPFILGLIMESTFRTGDAYSGTFTALFILICLLFGLIVLCTYLVLNKINNIK